VIRFIFIFLLAVSAVAQDVVINDFSGGLATKPGIFHVKPNQAREFYNLASTNKALSIRDGYDRIDTAYDTVRSIYNYTQRDGRKRLLGIVDDSLEGVADLVISEAYEYGIDTADGAVIGFSHIYSKGEMFWATWKSDAYWSNGRQRAKIIRDTVVRDMVTLAPGELRTIPIDAGSELDGEYQYVVISFYKSCDTASWYDNYMAGYSSIPIKVIDGRVLITNIPPPAYDTLVDIADTTGQYSDSVVVAIYRSLANEDNTDDTAFTYYRVWVDSLVPYGALDTLTIIDSIPDDSFGTGSYTNQIMGQIIGLAISNSYSLDLYAFRSGAPTYVRYNDGADSANYIFPRDTGDGGSPVIADSIVLRSVSYICTYIDTLTEFESDSSRALRINWTAGDTCYTIGVPKAPTGMEYLKRAIYKSYTYEVVQDTALTDPTVKDTSIYMYSAASPGYRWYLEILKNGQLIQVAPPVYRSDMESAMPTFHTGVYRIKFKTGIPNIFYRDSVITPYFKIGEIDDYTTLTFLDTTTFDSTLTGTIFTRPTARKHFGQLKPFGDRMWGIDRSNVSWSYLDTSGLWGAWSYIALNPDDGDENIAIAPCRDYMKVFKNKSQFILYMDSDYEYSRKWIVDGIGCVAPKSMVACNNGLIYLSNHGVVNETGSVYRDKGSDYGIISYPIDDLIDYKPSELRTAIGFLYDDKYWLSFPAKDTTYVYDLITGGWAIYGYAFSDATNYDTVQTATMNPPTEMVFTIKDDKGIYLVADTTQTDNGVPIIARWKSGPFAKSSRNVRIDKLGFWTDDNSSFSYVLYDAEDTAKIDSIKITPDDRYYLISPVINESNYFQLGITNLPDTSADLEINEIDIYVKPGTAEITH